MSSLHSAHIPAQMCSCTRKCTGILLKQKEPCFQFGSHHCDMCLIVQMEHRLLVRYIIIHRIFFIHSILLCIVGYKNINYCIFSGIYTDKLSSPIFFLLPSGPTKTFSRELHKPWTVSWTFSKMVKWRERTLNITALLLVHAQAVDNGEGVEITP